ncbi:MAG: riboflavin synthase [Candidatus Eremiobacteraeota bacterium]|nr:riboflavin synthase [Candidatus Eremiobacteraeota bacterium]MBC5803238.1 riboflavin synthase [Candidatus Eremiobacteraeota bacterium]MBC5823046.1 riboflavin synthase [Candidatus Eremiobacteraeota bacterium]
MFGGLIAHRGTVTALDVHPQGGVRLRVAAPEVAGARTHGGAADALTDGVAAKDSIAVDGVCLTVVANEAGTFVFDVVPETLARSTLGRLVVGSRVNVELSLRLGERIGGHLVYGHVDATAPVIAKEAEGQGHRVALWAPPQLQCFIVEKGYIAVDGVSLTVAAVRAGQFEIALIPETAARTTLGEKGAGDVVNLEVDPVARYVVNAAVPYQSAQTTSDELAWAYEI